MKMKIMSHGELERYHYAALRDDPQYREEFRQDVFREELMMAMPLSYVPQAQPEPEQWEYRQWQAVQRLKAELVYIRKQLAELHKKQPKWQPTYNKLLPDALPELPSLQGDSKPITPVTT